MKGADELHLELVFLFKLFLTFTFSCLFARWFSVISSNVAFSHGVNAVFTGPLLRKLQQAAF